MKNPLVKAAFAVLLILASCTPKVKEPVRVADGHFVRDGKPYTFIGTNFWYGPILASKGRGGDIKRLKRELDTLKAMGMDNLRVLVGGEGPDGVFTRVDPSLQTAPGVYNDTLLVGLDRFLVELGKRNMVCVLYLNNSWEWSGGYGQYLEWATGEKSLFPADGYDAFTEQMSNFNICKPAQELYFNHLRAIVGRVNSITGKPYKDDPAIFSWQIANEPRCFSDDPAKRAGMIEWITKAISIIKEIDGNHMVSLGSEGFVGCEQDQEYFEQVSAIPNIDYMTMHIWPYNWSWVIRGNFIRSLSRAFKNTDEYVNKHIILAQKLGQPLVVEEFGFPRDKMSKKMNSTTNFRDAYYQFIFKYVTDGKLDGANFWGWSGYAKPAHEQWQAGDNYSGDPAQEAQGLNGVYISDSTIKIIEQAISQLN